MVSVLLLAVLVGPFAHLTGAELIDTVTAQDPPEPPGVPDPGNFSQPEDLIFMIASTERAHATVPEHGQASFPVTIRDISPEFGQAVATRTPVRCIVENETEVERGWSLSIPPVGQVQRNSVKTIEIQISPGASPSPRVYSAEIACTAGTPLDQEIGRFVLSAKVDEFQRFSMMPAGAPPRVGPDEDVSFKVAIVNRGITDQRFLGSVDAPEGWLIQEPAPVVVPAGETIEVEISGFTPREKLWYQPSSDMILVSYWPESSPEKAQNQFVPISIQGLYLHPALVPFLLLAIAAILAFAMIVVYARRTVEEQVFGKPIPPWRIPVEREYLNRLEKEDPDEFYIVRYHLMVEEHQSALLWFKHFKGATSKDRKLERKWLKASESVKKRSGRVRGRQERMEHNMARRLRVFPVRRRRRLKSLEGRLISLQWKEQRKLLGIHKRSVRKIVKIHKKKEKKEKKQADAEFQKELKKVEKENKKRIKEGEVPVTPPKQPEWEYPEPDFPELVEVPLLPVEESVLAARAQRLSRRYNRKNGRRSAKAKKKMRKKGAKREKKVSKFKKKLPKAPSTHLFDEDEYVDPEDVVIEDSRSPLQRAFKIPPMEVRESLRRRRMVYKVKIQQAKQAKDPAQVERLKREYEKERLRILGRDQEDGKVGAQGPAGPPAPDAPEETVEGPEENGPLSLLRKRRSGARDAAKQASKGRSSVEPEDDSR